MTQQQEEKLIADVAYIRGQLGNGSSGVLDLQRKQNKRLDGIEQALPRLMTKTDCEAVRTVMEKKATAEAEHTMEHRRSTWEWVWRAAAVLAAMGSTVIAALALSGTV